MVVINTCIAHRVPCNVNQCSTSRFTISMYVVSIDVHMFICQSMQYCICKYMYIYTYITRHFNQGKDGANGVTMSYLEDLLGKSAHLVTAHVGVMGATVEVIKDLKKDSTKKHSKGKAR